MGAVPRPARRGAVLTFLLALAVLAGCSAGPSQRPPVAVRGAGIPAAPAPSLPTGTPDPLPEPDPQHTSLPLRDCTTDALAGIAVPADRHLSADCAQLTVPLDPADPSLGGVALGVIRVGSADAPLGSRPPILVLGDTATDPTARHAVRLAAQVPAALLAQYTLVGLDRRGTGDDMLQCAPADARADIVDADPAGFDPARLLERARAIVQECNLTLDGHLEGFSATAAAGDVEVLRAALGVAHLSAIGVGDGAEALVDWARTSPRAVGRLVLDGPAQADLDEPARSEARARAAEAAFDAFATACTGRGACPLGADPRAAVTTLLDGLRAHPLTTADGRTLGPGAAVTALEGALADPASWAATAAALAAAGTGNPVPLLDRLDALTGPRGTFDAALATRCNDVTHRLAPADIATLRARWRAAYPLFGGTAAVGLVACAPWPTAAPAPPPAPSAAPPPVLVLGTLADPRGTLDTVRRLAATLPGAVFASYRGAGTGAYPRTPCVTALVDGMLVDGAVPDAGVLCPA